MQHLLVDLNQVCTYDAPGVKLALPLGSQVWTYEQRRQTSKFFFSETRRCELSYLVYSISLWTSKNCIYMIPLDSELAPHPGDHKLEQ